MQIPCKLTFVMCLSLLIISGIGCTPKPIAPTAQPPSPPPQLPPPDTTAPDTIITIAPDETIGYNKVTFEWTGKDDRTPPANLTYYHYLEGYDNDYSPFIADTTKTYADLTDGTYAFYVKSRDKAGNVDPTPATIEFTIVTAPPE